MNAWPIELHPDARLDYLEALDWYLDRSVSVAQRFRDEFRQLVMYLSSNPELSPADEDGIRWRRMEKFPHVVYYRFKHAAMIEVLAVSHGSRDSEYWRTRK